MTQFTLFGRFHLFPFLSSHLSCSCCVYFLGVWIFLRNYFCGERKQFPDYLKVLFTRMNVQLYSNTYIMHVHTDDFLAEDALDPLLSFSLARRKVDIQSTKLKLSFHPLVLEWARESLDADERCRFMNEAICLVGRTYQHNPKNREMDEWIFGMQILHHINTTIENIQYLFKSNNTWNEDTMDAIAQIGRHCESHGLIGAAAGILEALLSNLVERAPSFGTTNVIGLLAYLYRISGQREKSLELGKIVLEFYEISLGNDHFHVAEIRADLCAILYKLGRYEESLESLELLLPVSERVAGKEHQMTLGWLVPLILASIG